MRSFMMHHNHPRLVSWSLVFEDLKCQVCDLFSNMSVIVLDRGAIFNEIWLKVFSLPFEDVPVVKTSINFSRLRIEMVLADDGGVVSVSLHLLRISPLALVECHVVILYEPVNVTVFGCENHSSCRPAKGIGNKGIVKPHTFFGNSVDVWCLDMNVIIRADSFERVVIRHHKQYIRSRVT